MIYRFEFLRFTTGILFSDVHPLPGCISNTSVKEGVMGHAVAMNSAIFRYLGIERP